MGIREYRKDLEQSTQRQISSYKVSSSSNALNPDALRLNDIRLACCRYLPGYTQDTRFPSAQVPYRVSITRARYSRQKCGADAAIWEKAGYATKNPSSRSTSQTTSPSRQKLGGAHAFCISLLSSILYYAFARARIRNASGSSVRASSRRPNESPNKRFRDAMTSHNFTRANFTFWKLALELETEVRMICNAGVDARADVVVEIEDSARLIRDKRGVRLA
jgi:hypothetical protein